MTDASLGFRGTLARWACFGARWASRTLGRGNGGMIGGLVALKVDPNIMAKLAGQRMSMIVTGTNGKSTTTRMAANALRTAYTVATNDGGDNMDAGIVSALNQDLDADAICLEVDEMHVPHVMDALSPTVLVLLNLSRDQLDRVGEINTIERRLREAVAAHPDTIVVANCDDMMVTSAAYDAKNVIWVSTGGGWANDATTSPRNNAAIMHSDGDWWAVEPLADGREFRRPTPDWWVDDTTLHGPDGLNLPLHLRVPGRANRGNAAQAVAAAVAMQINPTAAVEAAESVNDVAGRYTTITLDNREIHLLLAKNPAGWQEALNMVDRTADSLVIAVNGQEADGFDLSWLWDVRFENFSDTNVFCAGERGTDLSVRLTYAGVEHQLVHDPLQAIRQCPPGRVEVLANYTAFRDLFRDLRRLTGAGAGNADDPTFRPHMSARIRRICSEFPPQSPQPHAGERLCYPYWCSSARHYEYLW